MIILLILITFSVDNVLILLGDYWCWSLLGLKGLTGLLAVSSLSAEPFFWRTSLHVAKIQLRTQA